MNGKSRKHTERYNRAGAVGMNGKFRMYTTRYNRAAAVLDEERGIWPKSNFSRDIKKSRLNYETASI